SPVPGASSTALDDTPQLYALSPRDKPRQLTFARTGAAEPTVLADGRILFVSAQPEGAAKCGQALYTINNDGTEVTAFACQHERPALLERPRQLAGGRIAFLAAELD